MEDCANVGAESCWGGIYLQPKGGNENMESIGWQIRIGKELVPNHLTDLNEFK